MELRNYITTTVKKYLTEGKTDKIWYHGSDHSFTSFDNFKSSGPSALGIFVTSDRGLAELFGSNVYNVKITYNNPKTISMDKWDSIRDKHARDTNYFVNWRNELIQKGHDSIFIKGRSWTSSSGVTFTDGDIVILFDKKQLKIV
jgi:hypothetical protein